MRVLGGRLGSRTIEGPRRGIRPTSSKVRGAIFNMLAPRIQGARALDLFAGTGALGIEALSRGAAESVFVEADRTAARAIEGRLAALALPRARVLASDYRAAARRLSSENRGFDVIFVDPPYGRGLAQEALREVAACGLLRQGGVAVVEHRRTEKLPDRLDEAARRALVRVRRRRHGDTELSLFEVEPGARR